MESEASRSDMAKKMAERTKFCNRMRAGQDDPTDISRRRFLSILAALGVSSALPLPIFGADNNSGGKTKSKPPAPVFALRDSGMMDEFFNPQADLIAKNFNHLLATAAGTSDPQVAWHKW